MKKLQLARKLFQILYFFFAAAALNRFPQLRVVIVISIVAGGALMCAWLCPFGFMQEMTAKLGRYLGIKRGKLPPFIEKYGRFLRYLAGLFLFVTPLGMEAYIKIYEPRSGFFHAMEQRSLPSAIMVASIGAFLLLSVKWERLYCRYLCPYGAVIGIIGRLRIFTVKRSEDLCVSCQRCDKVCPSGIKVSELRSLRSPQCINCFECISACPVSGALKYCGAFKRKSVWKRQNRKTA